MATKFEQLSSEQIFANPYWEYRKDVYVQPSGNSADYHYVRTPGSVMIVPILENGRLLLTQQFRYLNQRDSIEFPGGGIKSDSTALVSAIAELCEETGAIAEEFELIGTFNPFNGVTDEICYVFSAKSIIFNIASPDESEEFVVLELTIDQIKEKILNGAIYDGMTITAFTLFYLKYLKDYPNV